MLIAHADFVVRFLVYHADFIRAHADFVHLFVVRF